MAAAVAADRIASAPANVAAAAAAVHEDLRVRVLSDILFRSPPEEIDGALSRCGISTDAGIVESVLRLSYPHPAAAVKFFRWSGASLKHTPLSWNLIVDILGRNNLHEAMWDAIRSMKKEEVLSAATFTAVFFAYCSGGRIKEAIMSYDVMERYGVPPDVAAVNSLLAAILREPSSAAGAAAMAFFERAKGQIAPDADTFAILLEGWEREGNVSRAKTTFGEMVLRVGWDAANVPAYDAFLSTLVRGGNTDDAISFLRVIKSKNCSPGMKFFRNALEVMGKASDVAHALLLWPIMVGESGGIVPDVHVYNAMISILCSSNMVNHALNLFDEMPLTGAFPDAATYNSILECIIRGKNAREADGFLLLMKKNDQPPTPANCAAAIAMFLDQFYTTGAIDVWSYVVAELDCPADECAKELLVGLSNLGRLSDVKRYAEEIMDMGIKPSSVTKEKMRSAFAKGKQTDVYECLERRLRKLQASSVK